MAVGVPVQHTVLSADSALAFAKERGELAHAELCAALATVLPGAQLVWRLRALILSCGAFACCEIRLSSRLSC